jgi:uncharacterized damage-inducible protein DinB
MSEKEEFLRTWEQEFQITLRVLKAMPEAHKELRPAPKSKTALELAWVFAAEERAGVAGVISGKIDFPRIAPPSTLHEVITLYEKAHREMYPRLQQLPEAALAGEMQFFTGPKQMGPMPKMAVLWLLLCDQIHHRGQFSVYLRLADARVPSIYGPTADEPWN